MAEERYCGHFLDTVRRKHAQPPTEEQLERILKEMRSPDDAVRARAVRRLCPCRAPWPIYQKYQEAIQELQKDSSPEVRHAAQHLTEDAKRLERVEDDLERSRQRQSEIREDRRRARCIRRRGIPQR